MIAHTLLTKESLLGLVRQGRITFAGNAKLKIYGRLNCRSGKRMKPENRIFFESQGEAVSLGYRPCGHCMKTEYYRWKLKKDN